MPRKKIVDDNKILKKILEVIKKVGATEFSLEDLRETTGLSPATLLQRFGSKKNIVYKAIELANYDLKTNFNKKILTNKSFIQEIIHIYLELSASFSHPNDVAGGLDILKIDINDKKLNALTRNYFSIRRKKIESLLILAKQKNELPPHIKVIDITWNLESLWQGSIVLWALTGNGSLSKWLSQRFESFFEAISGSS